MSPFRLPKIRTVVRQVHSHPFQVVLVNRICSQPGNFNRLESGGQFVFDLERRPLMKSFTRRRFMNHTTAGITGAVAWTQTQLYSSNQESRKVLALSTEALKTSRSPSNLWATT